VRIIRLDGSTAAVDVLVGALAAALDGGPTVLPLGPGSDDPGDDGRAGDDPGGVLVATSGSTGAPRLVALPVAALQASATATATRLGGPARWLLALPAEHVAGVQVIVRALLAGAAPVLQDLRGGFRPDGFAAATAALGPGRRCTSLVPTQLLRLLDAGGAALDALRGYAAVLVGGAALDPGLRARAEAAGVRVVTTYGMTETAGGCVYDGVPLDGVRVRLDAPEDDVTGRIALGGPTLAAAPATSGASSTAGWRWSAGPTT
jgi:O-succinylbenzoic acid--CoA ligase